MSRKNILIELQRVICPALALADAGQQDTYIDIARIHREGIRHPVRRAFVVAQLKVGTCHISIALLRRLSLCKHIGKGIDRLCVLLLLYVRMNLLCRNDFLLCHRHRPFHLPFLFPPRTFFARTLCAVSLTFFHEDTAPISSDTPSPSHAHSPPHPSAARRASCAEQPSAVR